MSAPARETAAWWSARRLLGSSTRVLLAGVALIIVIGLGLAPGHFLTSANVARPPHPCPSRLRPAPIAVPADRTSTD